MIGFMNTREHNATEIHRQLCEIYRITTMGEEKMWQ